MKRVVLGVLCLLLCACLLCGCAATPPAASGPSSPTAKPTTTTKPTGTTTTTSQTPDDDTRPVVALPQADAQTVHLSVDLPPDLQPAPYKQPQLLDAQQFEWGRYVPFVEHITDGYSKAFHEYERAFLGPNIQTFAQGIECYNRFDSLYKTTYPVISGQLNNYTDPLSENTDLAKWLFESHVIQITPDMQKVGTFSFLYKGTENPSSELEFHQWATEYKLYNGTQVVGSWQSETMRDMYDFFGDAGYRRSEFKQDLPNLYQGLNTCFVSEEYIIDKKHDFDSDTDILSLYSMQQNRLLYRLTLPSRTQIIDGYKCGFRGVRAFDGRRILFEIDAYRELDNFDVVPYQALYWFDLQTGKWEFVQDFAYAAAVSPDGKYLAFTNTWFEVTLNEQPHGFYVKNLDNGTITFYEVDNTPLTASDLECNVLGFVHYDTLMQQINR